MDEDFDEENVIEDCPSCGRTYDEIDQDYLICHHCGYDAEKKVFHRVNKRANLSRLGIDPDVQLDDWS